MIKINIEFVPNTHYEVYPTYGENVDICYDALREYWELPEVPTSVTLELRARPTPDTVPMMYDGMDVNTEHKYGEYSHFITSAARRQLTKLGVKKGVTYHVRCMV